MERMLLMLPFWRGFDILRLCERNGLDKTARWIRAVASRPSVQTTSAGADEMARASRRYYVEYASPGTPGEAVLESK